jgi:hypothetical protein
MWALRVLGTLAVVGSIASMAGAIEVKAEHPRIFLTRDEVPALVERCKAGGPVAAEYAAIKQFIDSAIAENRAVNGAGLPSLCIVYQVEKAQGNDARKYVDYLTKGLWGTDGKGGGSHLQPGRQWYPEGTGTVLDGFLGGNGCWFAWDAMTYDWFFDALTPEERSLYGDLLGRWLHSFMGLKPEQPAEITLQWGNYIYNQTWAPCEGPSWGNYYGRDGVGAKTLVALAITGAGTKYEDEAKQWLTSFGTKVPAEFIPYVERMGGVWPEGPDHGGGASLSMTLSLAAWRSATGQDLFADFREGGLRELTWWPLFAALPHSRCWSHINDMGAGMMNRVAGFTSRVAPLLAATYRQPEAQWMALNYTSTPEQRGWPFVLWYDPRVPAAKSSELPRAHLFKGTGETYMVSDWSGPDATWVYFVSGPQFIGYQSEEDGSFQVYKGGGLAMRGGTDRYTGTRPPSMNTVLIYNPDEKVPEKERNDGGTLPGVGSPPVPEERGSIIAYEHRPEYTYACADLAKAYSPTRVAGYTRQFLYLRGEPECFVVYDRVVSTRPEFPKLWLLHVMNEPVLYAGDALAAKGAAGEGFVTFADADRAIASTFTPDNNPEKNGRGMFLSSGFGALLCQTLLPEKPRLTKRGGPGFDNWGCPYSPADNRNFSPAQPGGEGGALIDRSWWRLEVEPTEQSDATEFLHVLSPILMPKEGAKTAEQLTLADFPAVTGRELTPDTVVLRVERGTSAWRVTLRRTGEAGGAVEHASDGRSTGRWDLAMEVKPNPSGEAVGAK